MKNVMFALLVLFVSFSVAQAQETTQPVPDQSAPAMQDDKVKIQPEDLPESVQSAIDDDNTSYEGWQIDAAFHYTKTDVYEVEMKKGAESKTVKFDAEGNVLEDESDEKSDK